MGKKLVIVESPAKAKTINKMLGKDYKVTSSVGHIRDLPERSIGVDIEHDFTPKYVVAKGKKSVVSELKKAAKSCDVIYLAPDPDREGEAIAWHIEEALKDSCKDKQFVRVTYNEITPRAVKAAFDSPGEINMHRVDAQQARRILDRIVGYKVSPVLWRRLRRGLSAGRVQSVALRLVCEREDAIDKFVPEAYWVLGAQVRKLVMPLDPFNTKLVKVGGEKAEIKSADQAKGILEDLEGRDLRVKEIATRNVQKRPSPPFITSTLQQAGSSVCSFSPQRTMSLAQQLYEGITIGGDATGLITYMRTDSFRISPEAQTACRDFVVSTFGEDFVPEKPNLYRSRSGAQEAHEAIRPTDVTRTPDQLQGKLEKAQWRLYKLIWDRFVASQMSPAEIAQRTVRIDAQPDETRTTEYVFQAGTSEVKFPGYMKVWNTKSKSTSSDGEAEQQLPPLREGEPLICLEWLNERKETKPPARFSEASLVKELEENGVGRPSTYAQIISTLTTREYVKSEKRTLSPTELGREVNALLVKDLGELFDVGFTAAMEASLDEIENGDVRWTEMLSDFYKRFEVWMVKTEVPPADITAVERVLGLFDSVTSWAPEYKRGKRTYSDEKFVESIREQLAEDKKKVSVKQLETLIRMAARYRDQIQDLVPVVTELGHKDILDAPDAQPPKPSTEKKLDLLQTLGLDEKTADFVGSLKARVAGGRCLTEAQLRALNNLVVGQSDKIEGFEAIKETLDLPVDQAEKDETTGILVEAMVPVKDWKEPVKRGKRVFDDKAFYESLSEQYQQKGFLTPRQQAALKRMVRRYRDHVKNYDAVADACGLKKDS